MNMKVDWNTEFFNDNLSLKEGITDQQKKWSSVNAQF